jgi:hypothetical protein
MCCNSATILKGYIMNKNIMLAALFAAGAASADVSINGSYEGTFTEGGAATYAQDLDLTLVGSAGGAKVTVMMEDLTGGSNVTTSQVFVEAGIEGLDFKGGNYKSQNGSGLLQAESAATNQFEVGTSIAGASVTVGQVSGEGKATIDAGFEVAGLDVNVQNVSATDRFITVVANFFGFGTTIETQETATGRNTGVSAGLDVAIAEGTSVNVTGVYIDVGDTAGVTQDDGILGDISDAATGSTVTAGVASIETDLGTVTGKYIVKNDLNTYVAELERGIMEYGYSKTEDEDGVFSAKLTVVF